jgi:hypothetical protein
MILWVLFLSGLLGYLIGPVQRVVTLFIFQLIS